MTPWYPPPAMNTTQNGYAGLTAAVGHTNSPGAEPRRPDAPLRHAWEQRSPCCRAHDAIYLPPARESTRHAGGEQRPLQRTPAVDRRLPRQRTHFPQGWPTEQGSIFCATTIKMRDQSQCIYFFLNVPRRPSVG